MASMNAALQPRCRGCNQTAGARGPVAAAPTRGCSKCTKRSGGVRAQYAGRATAVAHDVVLSSGFLAFAQHAGFLQAVEEAGVHVAGVMGTSAGALTGSLYAAGYSPKEAAALLSEQAPIQLLQPCLQPWRGGVLSLDGVVQRLSELLPPTFEGLDRDFAVGVVTADGQHLLIDSGPLPEAVAASAAIPLIFSAVDVPGGLSGLKDGGMVDRVGLLSWRQRRRQQRQQHHGSRNGSGSNYAAVPPCLVHVIERSSPFSGADDAEASGEEAVQVVRCPKSGVNFFDLGDFDRQFNDARFRANSRLREYVSNLPGMLQQQQQQQQPRVSPGVVLGTARRQPAAVRVAATGSSGSAGAASPAGGSLLAPRAPGSPRNSPRRTTEA